MSEPIRISRPEITRGSDHVTVSFEIDGAPIFFRIKDPGNPDFEPQKLGEAQLCTALFFAMKAGRDLESELPVSAEFLAKNQELQRIYHRWIPELLPVQISAPERPLPEGPWAQTQDWQPAARGAAVLFSGGVDSFYSALEFQDQLQYGIYIHGFDTKLEDENYRSKISANLQAAAEGLGIRLLEVETNLRDYSDDVLFWGIYHFAMISSVCAMLSADFERVYVPSSYNYEQLHPWGSHPLTDPLWGTGDLSYLHRGCGVTRVAKVGRISESEVARQHLRVCWENVDEAYNCGECEKCQRTMVNLAIFGRLEAFQPLFGKPLDIASLLPMVCNDKPGQWMFLRNNLREAKIYGADPQLIAELKAVDTAATEFFMTKAIAKRSGEADGDYFASAAWRDHLMPKVRNRLFDEGCLESPDWLAGRLVSSLGRDEVFDLLWQHDRHWLRPYAKKEK